MVRRVAFSTRALKNARLPKVPQPRFTSRLHDERVGAWLGIWLGISFTSAFVTGLISHVMQQPADWMLWPSRPVNLYRITQGVHVIGGLATIPLLLAKLWTVYPKLWQRVECADRRGCRHRGGVALGARLRPPRGRPLPTAVELSGEPRTGPPVGRDGIRCRARPPRGQSEAGRATEDEHPARRSRPTVATATMA